MGVCVVQIQEGEGDVQGIEIIQSLSYSHLKWKLSENSLDSLSALHNTGVGC